MAELKLISPLLSNMEVVECLSVRGAAAVYIVKSTKSGQTYILKHISVPESQKQVDALMFTGAAATTEDAQKYYEQVVSDYQTELTTLEALSASPNLDCFRSYQIAGRASKDARRLFSGQRHDKALRGKLSHGPLQRAHRSSERGAYPPRRKAVQHLLKRAGSFPARRPRYRKN